VSEFRYLGHVISDNQSDVLDIQREVRSLFARSNMLKSRFSLCSCLVKLRLFQAYCMCFYDIALWNNFSNSSLNSLLSAYNRCIKIFFGFAKHYSVTCMLMELGLPTFNTILHNSAILFKNRLLICGNSVINNFTSVC
jgi:hypothetical protein